MRQRCMVAAEPLNFTGLRCVATSNRRHAARRRKQKI